MQHRAVHVPRRGARRGRLRRHRECGRRALLRERDMHLGQRERVALVVAAPGNHIVRLVPSVGGHACRLALPAQALALAREQIVVLRNALVLALALEPGARGTGRLRAVAADLAVAAVHARHRHTAAELVCIHPRPRGGGLTATGAGGLATAFVGLRLLGRILVLCIRTWPRLRTPAGKRRWVRGAHRARTRYVLSARDSSDGHGARTSVLV